MAKAEDRINVPKPKLDSLFGGSTLNAGFAAMLGSQEVQLPEGITVMEIPLAQLQPFGYDNPERRGRHRFKPYSEEKMAALASNIKDNGIRQPLLVRKRSEGVYEILAGHNRKAGAALAGLQTAPCIVRDVDDDQADLDMAETNLYQRDELLPLEKGWGYRVALEAMNRQGRRSDLTSSHNGTKLTSGELLAKTLDTGKGTIYRYIRLTYLIECYQNMVDDGEIPVVVGEQISHLTEVTQNSLLQFCRENEFVLKPEHAEKLKAAFSDKDSTVKEIERVLLSRRKPKVEKEKPIRISITPTVYEKYFSGKKAAEAEKLIIELLEKHFNNIE